MKKRNLTGKAITIADWMRQRPYEHFTTYDGYYLRIANTVFELLNDRELDFQRTVGRDELKTIAVSVTGYFEDFINDIGIWQAVRRVNKRLYGVALPIYHEHEAYDEEYINPEDISFLIWHLLSEPNTSMYDPFAYSILEGAERCFDFFEDMIEGSLTTDFYKKWLVVAPDINLFTLKDKLKWMALENYLIGPNFHSRLINDLDNFVAKHSNYSAHDLSKSAYMIQEDYAFSHRSSWNGMNALEWFVEVVQLPEPFAEDVRRMSNRITGEFIYAGYDDRHYFFEYMHTGRQFEIVRESIVLATNQMVPGVDFGVFSILPWQGSWWLSGSYLGWQIRKGELEKFRRQNIGKSKSLYYGQTPENQQRLLDLTQEMERAFKAYFSDNPILFSSAQEAEKAIHAHNAWWNDQMAVNKNAAEGEAPPNSENTAISDELGPGAVGVYFVPGEGLFLSKAIPNVVQWLQAEALTERDSLRLFQTFFMELLPELGRALIERYGARNLRFPLDNFNENLAVNFMDFFQRFYNPQAQDPPVPANKLVDQTQL